MDSVGGWYITNHGADVRNHLVADAVEVSEKAGAIVALDPALAYLATETAVIRFVLRGGEPEHPPT